MQFDQLRCRQFITLLGGGAATWPLAARAQRTPEWMFDRAVCCGMVHGDSPRVSRAALYRILAARIDEVIE